MIEFLGIVATVLAVVGVFILLALHGIWQWRK